MRCIFRLFSKSQETLFLPGTGCTWLLTEIDPEEPDLAFGHYDLGMGFPELGHVSLKEITSVKKSLRP